LKAVHPLLKLLLVNLVVILFFLPQFSFTEFRLDDQLHFFRNPLFQQKNKENFWRIWTEPYASAYTPVTYSLWFSLIPLARVFPANGPAPVQEAYSPRPFYIANLILHLLCVSLVFALVLQLSGSASGALIGGLLFGLHPLHVESVAWITECRGLLASLFVLASTWIYVHTQKASMPERVRWSYYLGQMLLLVLGLLSKPSALVAPAIWFSLGFFYFRQPLKKLAWQLSPVLLLFPLLHWLQSLNSDFAKVVVIDMTWMQKVGIALDILRFYVIKFFIPVGLVFDYGRPPEVVLTEPNHKLFALGFCLIAGGLIYLVRRNRIALTTLSIFIVSLIPFLGLAVFVYEHISTVADRYTYLAIAGPALGLGVSYARLQSQLRKVAVGFVMLLGILCFMQLSTWKTNEALYLRTVSVNPRSIIAWTQLGFLYAKQGDFENSLHAYRQASRWMKGPDIRRTLGVILTRLGRIEEANAEFALANRIPPPQKNTMLP
jgi:protein O-mannosyl-transferase